MVVQKMNVGFHLFFIITMCIGYGIAIYGKWLEQRDKKERKKDDKKQQKKGKKKSGKSSTKNGGGKTPKRYYIQHKIFMNTRR